VRASARVVIEALSGAERVPPTATPRERRNAELQKRRAEAKAELARLAARFPRHQCDVDYNLPSPRTVLPGGLLAANIVFAGAAVVTRGLNGEMQAAAGTGRDGRFWPPSLHDRAPQREPPRIYFSEGTPLTAAHGSLFLVPDGIFLFLVAPLQVGTGSFFLSTDSGRGSDSFGSGHFRLSTRLSHKQQCKHGAFVIRH